jgi:hypothetical protein
MALPLLSSAVKARVRPSGDSAGAPLVGPSPCTACACLKLNRASFVGAISETMARTGARARRQYETVLTMAARRKTTASAPYSCSLMRPFAVASRLAAGVPPPSAIHLSSVARSRVFCHRSSGSFARHFLTTLSSDVGVSVAILVQADSGRLFASWRPFALEGYSQDPAATFRRASDRGGDVCAVER